MAYSADMVRLGKVLARRDNPSCVGRPVVSWIAGVDPYLVTGLGVTMQRQPIVLAILVVCCGGHAASGAISVFSEGLTTPETISRAPDGFGAYADTTSFPTWEIRAESAPHHRPEWRPAGCQRVHRHN